MQISIHPEVSDALADGRAVVALESTIISHGLPRPDNLRVAREIEDSVRAGGAVPATIAVVDGVPRSGLDDDGHHTHRPRLRRLPMLAMSADDVSNFLALPPDPMKCPAVAPEVVRIQPADQPLPPAAPPHRAARPH